MKRLYFKSYMNTIHKSLGSELFQNFFVDENDEQYDVLDGGELSCAYFVTSILKWFDYMDSIHATVLGTENEILKNSSWIEVTLDSLLSGDVIFWEKIKFPTGGEHAHVGFYVGDGMAISNSEMKKCPMKHSKDFEGFRKILNAYRHNDFSKYLM